MTFFGSMITYVALPFQAYQLTGSSLVVGALGVAEFAPLILMALVGGALADAHDRRRMVQLTELGFAGASAVLVLNATLDSPKVWVLFACSVVMAALDGLQRPSLDGLVPRLVERDELPAAGALSSFRMTIGMVVGPAIGGVLIATIGLPLTYTVDVATFLVSLAALRLMRAVPPPPGAEAPVAAADHGGRPLRAQPPRPAGHLRRRHRRHVLRHADGAVPGDRRQLRRRRGARAAVRGAQRRLAARDRLQRLDRRTCAATAAAICLAAAGWGAAIVAFGLTDNLPVALVFLAIAGGADMISGLFRSVMWNSTIPDELRGRLAGIEQVSYSTGPLLGNVESGVAASLIGVRGAVVSGGILCVVGVAVTAVALPVFWRYRSEPAPAPAEPVRS